MVYPRFLKKIKIFTMHKYLNCRIVSDPFDTMWQFSMGRKLFSCILHKMAWNFKKIKRNANTHLELPGYSHINECFGDITHLGQLGSEGGERG